MRRYPAVAVVVVVVVGIGIGVGEIRAGVAINEATGTIFYQPNDPVFEGGTRTYTPKIPGGDKLAFLKGLVSQDSVIESSGTFAIDVHTFIDADVNQPAPDSRAAFEMTFTTEQPLRYRFSASLAEQGPQFFQAKLDDVTASAALDAFGNGTGTMPFNPDTGMFGSFADEGTLAAGEHTLLLEAIASQGKSGARSSAGTASLVVQAIPLPPAVGPGIVMLAVLGTATAIARMRRTRAARL